MSKGAFGKSKFKVKGTDGKVYDTKAGTVDGMPPVEPGDVFFYRPMGAAGAQVTKVKLTRLVGKIASLVLLNGDDKPEAFMFADMRRVEVVQMAAPVDFVPSHYEELILRRHHLLQDFREDPIESIDLKSFPEEYLEEITAAAVVRFVDGERAIMLKSRPDSSNEQLGVVTPWDELESPAENSGSPALKHKDFPTEGIPSSDV